MPATKKPTKQTKAQKKPAAPKKTRASNAKQPRSYRWFRLLCFVIAIVLFVVASLFLYAYSSKTSSIRHSQINAMQQVADDTTQKIDAGAKKIEGIANQLSKQLSDGKLAYDQVQSIAEEQLKTVDYMSAVGITFEPYVRNPDKKLSSTFYIKQPDGKIKTVEHDDRYDYVDTSSEALGHNWYKTVVKGKKGMWLEPYRKGGASDLILEYNVPFYKVGSQGKKVAGVISMYITFSDLWLTMQGLKVDFITQHMLYHKSGMFVYHEESAKVGYKNVYQLPDGSRDKDLVAATEKALDGKITTLQTTHLLGGGLEFTLIKKLAIPDLVYAFSVDGHDFFWYKLSYFKLLFVSFLCFTLAIILLALAIFFPVSFWLTWALIGFYVIVCFALNLSLIHHQSRFKETTGEHAIFSHESLESYRDLVMIDEGIQEVVPIGMSINQLTINDQGLAAVRMLIWAIYQHKPTSTKMPFAFENTSRAFTSLVDEHKVDGGYLQLWEANFSTYGKSYNPRFPFNNPVFTVGLISKPSGNVLFVPHLESYSNLNPAALPGLDSGARIRGWKVNEILFSYKTEKNHIGILMNDQQRKVGIQEFMYNIVASRDVLSIFLGYQLPLIIILILVFLRLMNLKYFYNSTLTSKYSKLDAASLAGNLTYFTGTFFVLILANTRELGKKSGTFITYIEMCYFISYLIVIAAAFIVAVAMVRRKPKGAKLSIQQAGVVKYVYWPLVVTLFMIVTLVYF